MHSWPVLKFVPNFLSSGASFATHPGNPGVDESFGFLAASANRPESDQQGTESRGEGNQSVQGCAAMRYTAQDSNRFGWYTAQDGRIFLRSQPVFLLFSKESC